MPPNEKCPCCGELLADWHREWHSLEDQARIFQGTAGMECPLCHETVMHSQWQTPLTPANTSVQAVKRVAVRAAQWADYYGQTLESYLQTAEGQPFASLWNAAEVAQADKVVAPNNP
jgi:hypothetical protein